MIMLVMGARRPVKLSKFKLNTSVIVGLGNCLHVKIMNLSLVWKKIVTILLKV